MDDAADGTTIAHLYFQKTISIHKAVIVTQYINKIAKKLLTHKRGNY